MTKKLKIFDFVITALLVCAITVLIVMTVSGINRGTII